MSDYVGTLLGYLEPKYFVIADRLYRGGTTGFSQANVHGGALA